MYYIYIYTYIYILYIIDYSILFSHFGHCSSVKLRVGDVVLEMQVSFMFGVHEADVPLSSALKLFLSNLFM